jgi:hypothetical protein
MSILATLKIALPVLYPHHDGRRPIDAPRLTPDDERADTKLENGRPALVTEELFVVKARTTAGAVAF